MEIKVRKATEADKAQSEHVFDKRVGARYNTTKQGENEEYNYI